MTVAIAASILLELSSLVILELLRKNNKDTKSIRYRLAEMDERLEINRQLTRDYIDKLTEEIKKVSEICTKSNNNQAK